ncbi:alanine transporter [Gordoniibacillus kamchatkensis]|uniref:Teichoic acid D-alanyltransferase n=1 Tax=Gordoniibacillus kamchatkensis TaxID=1590651 RepID=A0ABR5AK65_9BACL|nr:D-alanyl-lipoteichoic acid biosynthesis protein DltB [Paenibacillus sp. VKM B-2647]KIL41345.1 alanine transporter [Paenibacillus sp. VKM B-2647]
MVPYTSFAYLGLSFLLLLPSIVAGLLGKRVRWYDFALTVAFVGIMFAGNREQLLFLIGYTVWQWLLIKGALAAAKKPGKTYLHYLLVGLSVAPLAAAKMMAVSNPLQTFAFLGISYLTFKCVQMIFEIRDGQIQEVSVWSFLSFLWFFPTLTSGPIDRYRRYRKDLQERLSPASYRLLLYEGIHHIFRGLLYKFLIGYLIKTYLLSLPLLKAATFYGICSYMYAYSFYLFFDFAGYSAFAVGFSCLLGIRTPDNFRYPFLSRNMKDFWNRWHITLSHWFRDFVYMRITMLLARRKLIKNRYAVSSAGYGALFILMGFWHGLELHYIVYGLYHAVLMIGYDGFERLNKRYKFWPGDRAAARAVSTLLTFHVACFGFLIFSGRLF